jgi:rod shape-determining protein MreB
VIDIGGGTSEVGLISLGGIVLSQSLRIGGYELDEAIINHVRREYQFAIGQQTAEDVKLAVGSAWPLDHELETEIRGRDVVSGLPKVVTLTSEEVRHALDEPVQAVVDVVKDTLERTPPELAADIADRGLMLAGGGSLLRGFDERLWNEIQIPANLVESPLTCVAVGAGHAIEQMKALGRAGAGFAWRSRSRPRRRARRGALSRVH